MRDVPGAHQTGVEEMLRWVSPIKNMSRTVVNEVELRGETLHAGDQVILMYPSANRDADEFPDPFTFDVRRDPNHHIAFGFGPHYCLGQALARLELNVMFDVLFRASPRPRARQATSRCPTGRSNFIVGPEAMPVKFTPTAKVA